MSGKRSHIEFVEKLKGVHPLLIVVGEYKNSTTKVLVRDNIGIVYSVYPDSLLRGWMPSIRIAIDKNDAFRKMIAHKNKNVTVIGNYITGDTEILVRDEQGVEYLLSPNHLMKGYSLSVITAIDKTKWFIKKSKLIHDDRYIYDLVDYKNATAKVKIGCKEHRVFEQIPADHLDGSGCPECGREKVKENFTRTGWINSCIQKDASIYVIEIYNNDERFIKVGITSTSIAERFIGGKLPYKFKLLYLYTNTPMFIYNKEKELHRRFREYKYILRHKFGGYTECFNILVLNEIKDLNLFKIAV